jgi:hypothetical protein
VAKSPCATRRGGKERPLNGNVLSALRRRSPLRTALTLLCLLTCTIQSFVAQTHVHVETESTGAATAYVAERHAEAVALAQESDRDIPRRGGDNYSHCPLCQIVLHGGGLPLLTHAFFLPLVVATATSTVEQPTLSSIASVSYYWQSRGPPLS